MKNQFLRVLLVCATYVISTGAMTAQVVDSVRAYPSSCGLADGRAKVFPYNAAGPFFYTWSTGASSDSVFGLLPGAYSVTVYNGSVGAADSIVSAVNIATRTVSATPTITQPSCGKNNGVISCSISANNFTCTFMSGTTILQQGVSSILSGVGPGVYTFILVEPATGCSDTIKNINLVDPTTHPTFNNIQIIPEKCFGDKKGSIHVTLGNCSGNCVYAWSHDSNNHTDSAVALTAGTYTFSVSDGVCTNVDTIIVVPGPGAKLVIDTFKIVTDHCDKKEGYAFARPSGGTPPFSYAWSSGISVADSALGLAGDSTIRLTVTDSHGCVDSTFGKVGNTPLPTAVMSTGDTVCFSEMNGTLIVTPTSNDGPFTYLWDTHGNKSNVLTGIGVGRYVAQVTNKYGCSINLNGDIAGYPQSIDLVADRYEIYEGESIGLIVQVYVPPTDVRWEPYFGSNGSLQAYDKPRQSTNYHVTVTYGQHCQLTDSLFILVDPDTLKPTVPNTFTPNGDGVNDNFYITPIHFRSFHMWIYDRWGNKVYETTDPDFRWDGTNVFAGNSPMNTGVFSYVIEYYRLSSDEKNIIGGNISLIK